ncbi:MAG: hypothetical protein GX640_08325 [Fibrobacter sp.]|nr:hypothetical protein [Fibrobacter sp.]
MLNASPSQVDSYEQMAKARGYSQSQIDQMKLRYRTDNTTGTRTYINAKTGTGIVDTSLILDPYNISNVDTIKSIEDIDTAKLLQDTVKGLPHFGYSLFKKTPEAFRPNAIGPVDPGYLVGPGDVLRLSVWGQVEFQYELTVSKDGKIFIPVAGQVYVMGVPFEQLQQKIKNLLSKHYSGLATNPPRTFIDMTVAQLRPVRVFIMGEVAAPGGYTVPSGSTVFNALYSVGGPDIKGSLRSIKVHRNGEQIADIDIYQYLLSGRCSTDVRLQNNDVIFIPKRGKTVAAVGSVFRPAIYELKDGDNLKALIGFCGGIPAATNVDRAQICRILPFDQRNQAKSIVRVIDLDFKKYLHSNDDFVLNDNDSLKVIPLTSDLKNYVNLTGAVKYPGVYQADSLNLHDLVFKFGQPVENEAFMKRADIIRRNDDLITTSVIPVNLQRLMKDPSYNMGLKPFDEIIVYHNRVEKPADLHVIVNGEVNYPDTITLSTNLTVTDAILRCGGFTRAAYRKAVDVYRLDMKDPESLTKIFKVELPDSLDYSDKDAVPFVLKDRDVIIVRPDPDYNTENYVQVDGLVKYRGNYAIAKRGERIDDIIDRAGGVLPDAFLEGATFTREGKRLVINFAEALSGKQTYENVLVQKGDKIFIPPRPNTVFVHGNTNNPGLFSYVKNCKVRDYIDRAGGLADSSAFILLTAPNGETEKLKIRGLGNNPVVEDGSEIYITRLAAKPAKEKNGPSIGEIIKDTLAIMVSAASLVAIILKYDK